MHFVGRGETLVELENQLAGAGTLAITAIKGMGGIGKTELALQYAVAARRLGKYPGGICWIDVRGRDVADEILDFANNYLDFVPPDDQSLEKKVEICWNLWSQSFGQEKLLVLDDVEAYSQIKRYLPPYDPSLKVIITTRLRLEPLNIRSLVLEVLSDDDALNLLRAYIEIGRVDRELEYAQKLCEWVGNLPLGLTSIGRYLREFPEDSLEEVIERLQEQGLDDGALQEPEISIGNGETTANLWHGERRLYENVYAVFNLNWKELCQPGRQLGAILSLFNAPPYTWSLVEKAAKPLGEIRGEAKISLKDLHIFHEEEDNPIHPLIQEFFLKKLKQNRDFLGIQDVLFDNFVFQQYVYDTGYLENSLERVEKMRASLPKENIKGNIVLSKMIGHSYYVNRATSMRQSIENMIVAQEFAEQSSSRVSKDKQEEWLWYQLFCLDHTHNLLATTPEGQISLPKQELTADMLQAKVEALLPESLRQINTPPSAEISTLILRAAHYWGHRGNQISYRLFRDITNLPFADLELLYSDGIEYYARAAVFRLLNFRLSCPKEYQKHLKDLMRQAPHIPEWLSSWNPENFHDHNIIFERFTSASQAIGDTAHQYRGIADIRLWGYLYKVTSGRVDQGFLKETERTIEITRALWSIAKNILKPNEKIIKYYLWIANLETKFELVRDHYLSKPLITWDEAERRLIEDLDKLEEDYRLSYSWARKISVDQLRKFYEVIKGVYSLAA
jgi:NB-ARC domain